jgi:hypothetical protein
LLLRRVFLDFLLVAGRNVPGSGPEFSAPVGAEAALQKSYFSKISGQSSCRFSSSLFSILNASPTGVPWNGTGRQGVYARPAVAAFRETHGNKKEPEY